MIIFGASRVVRAIGHGACATAIVASLVALGAGSAPGVGAAPALQKPAVPSQGAYVGAWVMPSSRVVAAQNQAEISHLADFDASIGRPLAIVQLYQSWLKPPSLSALNAIASTGAVPLVSWRCDEAGNDSDATVVSRADDATITHEALTLKEFGRPVFLRWFWEFNITSLPDVQSCLGYNPQVPESEQEPEQGADFVAAWNHIWQIFRNVDATNVAFVWNPSLAPRLNIIPPATLATSFYPGSASVDWIAGDCYERAGTGQLAPSTPNFQSCFDDTKHSNLTNSWYATFGPSSGFDKPLMVGETGAPQASEAQELHLMAQGPYLESPTVGVETVMPEDYPGIKALVYLDTDGASHWTLKGAGLQAFAHLANDPYFRPMAGNTG